MNHKQMKGKVITGVLAQRFHTVLYNKDSVYTFGLNAGQLGRVYHFVLYVGINVCEYVCVCVCVCMHKYELCDFYTCNIKQWYL